MGQYLLVEILELFNCIADNISVKIINEINSGNLKKRIWLDRKPIQIHIFHLYQGSIWTVRSSGSERPTVQYSGTGNCGLERKDPRTFWNWCVVFWDLSTKKMRFRIWWSICSFRGEWVSVKIVGSKSAFYCKHFMKTFQLMHLVENALLAKMVHPFSRPDRKDAFGGFLPSDKIDE